MELDLKELIKTIISPLVDKPEDITLDVQDGEEFIEYHIGVAHEDLGHVIGRQGRIIQAVRTIIYSIPVEGKKVRLIVDQDD
ncbi:MAG: KH domain-containing protein [Streptococcaceae bacterium]|jgi:predicted RNA-binding protein YlqC (UPF0109 family)|nr:KH domain-containing protein [Streptococcaceae bacterium]